VTIFTTGAGRCPGYGGVALLSLEAVNACMQPCSDSHDRASQRPLQHLQPHLSLSHMLACGAWLGGCCGAAFTKVQIWQSVDCAATPGGIPTLAAGALPGEQAAATAARKPGAAAANGSPPGVVVGVVEVSFAASTRTKYLTLNPPEASVMQGVAEMGSVWVWWR